MKSLSFVLTLLIGFSLSALANISEWSGLYRGVCVIEQTDGKRHEIQCELQIVENPNETSSQVLSVKHSEGLAVIQILNLSSAPKHLTVQLSEEVLGIAPLFAHPVSIKLQKKPGGFNETLIVGDLVEYNVSYAQEARIINTLHLKLGKLQ